MSTPTKLASRSSLVALAVTLALGMTSAVSAQAAESELSADEVVAQIQAFYDQTDTIEASFHQTYYHALYRRYQRSSGNMVFDKPGRMRFDYSSGKVIVSDGNLMTAFDPGDEGEPGQYLRRDADASSLPSAFSFLTGEGRIADDYTAHTLSSTAWGYRGHVIELRPRVANTNIKRVVLFVDARESLRGVVHRLRIDDHDGNRNKFTMRRLRFNRGVSNARFRYVPPADARRISS